MKVLISVDSSPSSQQLLKEVAARPWLPDTVFCVATAIDLALFLDLPELVEDLKKTGRRTRLGRCRCTGPREMHRNFESSAGFTTKSGFSVCCGVGRQLDFRRLA